MVGTFKKKKRIRNKCIHFSKEKKWRESAFEQKVRHLLTTEARLLDQRIITCTTKYVLLKSQLDKIEDVKCRGAAVRSRVQNFLEGEKSTGYFLRLENRNQERTTIDGILNEDGVIVNTQDKIVEQVYVFYKDLFTSQAIDKSSVNTVLSSLTKTLSAEDSEWCDADFKKADFELAISSLNDNKSPGQDGLNSEFYKKFKCQLMPILSSVFSAMADLGTVPNSFTDGVINIFYKKKGDKHSLSNYRPISLLNTDYKILTKMLVNRMKHVIASIVGDTQAYSIPGRNISDSILTVKDTVRMLSTGQGIWLGIDLQKAFDRVEHSFLYQTLTTLGFGQHFVGWIRLLYSTARSRVKCNGELTKSFCRSIRQECPLSSLLYSLVAEPLAAMLVANVDIQGIALSASVQVKIVQYADDVNVFVKSVTDMDKFMFILRQYELASGPKLILTNLRFQFLVWII